MAKKDEPTCWGHLTYESAFAAAQRISLDPNRELITFIGEDDICLDSCEGWDGIHPTCQCGHSTVTWKFIRSDRRGLWEAIPVAGRAKRTIRS
jgi:hypothetical protein